MVLLEEISFLGKGELETKSLFWLCPYFNIYGRLKEVQIFVSYNHSKESIKFHLY